MTAVSAFIGVETIIRRCSHRAPVRQAQGAGEHLAAGKQPRRRVVVKRQILLAGRDMAGVHWRSDSAQGLLLGEAVTISVLRDQRATYNETFNGFTFTKFDGSSITV